MGEGQIWLTEASIETNRVVGTVEVEAEVEEVEEELTMKSPYRNDRI